MKMFDFQSQFAVAAEPKLESFPTLSHDDQIGSLNISTPYQVPWINPTSSSSSSLDSVLFEDGPLDLSDMDTLVKHIGCMDSWGILDEIHESTSKALKPLSMPISDPQLDIFNAFMEKCNSAEDAYLKATSHGSFLPDVRSVNFVPGYSMGQAIQEDLYGSIHSEPNLKLAEIESKHDAVLKLPAKRSITARPAQLRPTKKVALHHQSGEREISQKQIHILSERERRKGMNNLFENMRSLLPNSIQKADKSTIVSDIISYIQSLQQELEDLNKKKAKLTSSPGGTTHTTKTEPSCPESIISECTESDSLLSLPFNEDQCSRQTSQLTLHFTENDIFITVCCLQKLNILPAIVFVIEDHKLQIMSANVSTTDTVAFHCFHAKALETPDMTTKQSLKCALKKFVCSDSQLRFE